jgi:hypothetical protein
MSLIGLILLLVVVGVILWLVNSYIPMDAKIKKILNVVVVIIVILWLLSLFVDLGSINTIHVGNHFNHK